MELIKLMYTASYIIKQKALNRKEYKKKNNNICKSKKKLKKEVSNIKLMQIQRNMLYLLMATNYKISHLITLEITI